MMLSNSPFNGESQPLMEDLFDAMVRSKNANFPPTQPPVPGTRYGSVPASFAQPAPSASMVTPAGWPSQQSKNVEVPSAQSGVQHARQSSTTAVVRHNPLPPTQEHYHNIIPDMSQTPSPSNMAYAAPSIHPSHRISPSQQAQQEAEWDSLWDEEAPGFEEDALLLPQAPVLLQEHTHHHDQPHQVPLEPFALQPDPAQGHTVQPQTSPHHAYQVAQPVHQTPLSHTSRTSSEVVSFSEEASSVPYSQVPHPPVSQGVPPHPPSYIISPPPQAPVSYALAPNVAPITSNAPLEGSLETLSSSFMPPESHLPNSFSTTSANVTASSQSHETVTPHPLEAWTEVVDQPSPWPFEDEAVCEDTLGGYPPETPFLDAGQENERITEEASHHLEAISLPLSSSMDELSFIWSPQSFTCVDKEVLQWVHYNEKTGRIQFHPLGQVLVGWYTEPVHQQRIPLLLGQSGLRCTILKVLPTDILRPSVEGAKLRVLQLSLMNDHPAFQLTLQDRVIGWVLMNDIGMLFTEEPEIGLPFDVLEAMDKLAEAIKAQS
ncbi:MAG: hypothetical protein ACKO37_08465 [Vampirovibrionales bacterium]